MIHALLNVYNDRMFLAACLESLVDNVDTIIVADGAYNLYYEHYLQFDRKAKPWSTDGSLEIIKSFRDGPEVQWIRPPEPEPNSGLEAECWSSQTVKRSALIDAVPDGDSFLIIDADEMLAGDFQEGVEGWLESELVCCHFPLYCPGTEFERVTPKWHPRLFRKTEGMHYRGTHWHLRDRFGRIIEEKYPIYWTGVMSLIHLKPFKTKARLIPHANYMNELGNQGWLEPTDLGKVLMKSTP